VSYRDLSGRVGIFLPGANVEMAGDVDNDIAYMSIYPAPLLDSLQRIGTSRFYLPTLGEVISSLGIPDWLLIYPDGARGYSLYLDYPRQLVNVSLRVDDTQGLGPNLPFGDFDAGSSSTTITSQRGVPWHGFATIPRYFELESPNQRQR
jgi:hypothetical protein